MGYLHIANCLRQDQIIVYRLGVNREGDVDERLKFSAPKSQTIKGCSDGRIRQEVLGGDLHPNQMNQIIEQLEIYGLIAAMDVPNNLPKRQVPYIYNIGAPVPPEAMKAVYDHNFETKTYEGADRRKKAAVGANRALMDQTGNTPGEFDVEIEQEDPSPDDSRTVEGFHVVPQGPATPLFGRGKRA